MSTVSSYQLSSSALCGRLSNSRSHQLVAFGCADKDVHILRFGDGNIITRLDGSTAPVTAVTFDKDQERVVGGCEDGGVRVWDLKSSASIRTLGHSHKDTISCVDYHPFGDFVATASADTCLRIWDMRRRTSLQSYKGTPAPLRVCRFAPSGKWVASGCDQGIIRLYDLGSGKELNRFEAHTGAITSIAFHPEQFLMAATSADGTLSLWNLEEQVKVYQSNYNLMPAAYTGVQFMQKGLLAANSRMLRLYDFKAMGDSKARSIPTAWDAVSDLAYAPASEDALAVECRGTTVSMCRVSCKGAATDSPPPQQQPKVLPTTPPSNARVDYQAQRVVREPIPSRTKPVGGGAASPATSAPAFSDQDQRPPPRINSARAAIPLVPGRGSAEAPPSASDADEDAVIDGLDTTSAAMTSVLGRRVTHLRVCRQMWPDIRGVLSHLQRVLKDGSDGGVLADFLNVMQHQRIKERITIEVLPDALGLVAAVLAAQKMEVPLLSAIRISRSLNTKFRQRIDDALKGAAFAQNGVDISMEARINLSKKAQLGFDEIYYGVAPFVQRTDQLGEEARSLIAELPRPPR